MVDDDHGDGVAALQLSQIGEQRRHLTAGVLIDAMQTHEGIEHEQAWLQVGDGVVEASAVGREIQSHGGCGDDLDVEIGKAEAGGGADAVEPPAHPARKRLFNNPRSPRLRNPDQLRRGERYCQRASP